MATTILIPEKDPMGAAISDFFNLHRADRLRVFSSQFEEDEIPVKELFRSMPSMPMLERTALQMATGQILDVGAGSGCHALALQDMGKEVCAIDISPLSVEVMKQRGVKDSRLINLFDETFTETLFYCDTNETDGMISFRITEKNGTDAQLWRFVSTGNGG